MRARTVIAVVVGIVASTMFAPASTFTGAVNSDWNNPDNWSAGIPAGREGALIPDGATVDVTATPPTFNADFDVQVATVNITGSEVVVTFASNAWWGRNRGLARINIRDGARLNQISGNTHFGTDQNTSTTMVLDNGTFDNLDQIKNGGGTRSRMCLLLSNGSVINGKHFWLRSERADQSGFLRGSGTISVTDSFKNNGRVEAVGGVLSFTSFGGGLWDDNGWPIEMSDGRRAGWYASDAGRLDLPTLEVNGSVSWGEAPDDSTLDIVNSLRIDAPDAAGTVSISLLAADEAGVRAGLIRPIGIWEVETGGALRRAEVKIRYDDHAAAALGSVKLLHHAGAGWVEVTAGDSRSIISSNSAQTLAGQFAVAEDAEDLVNGDGTPFRRGDADGDGSLRLTDAVRILTFLFQGVEAPDCVDTADADNDNEVLLTDAVLVLAYLFQQGAAPLDPGPDVCGEDPDGDDPADDLTCERYGSCE